MQKHTQQLVLMLVIGFLLGFGASALFAPGVPAEAPVLPAGEETTPQGTPEAERVVADSQAGEPRSSVTSMNDLTSVPMIPSNSRARLRVDDQLAGAVVHVASVSPLGVQWVAIYDDRGGKPGWILGARRVSPSDTEITVELLRSTLSGGTYYAALLNDDGDGVFDLRKDLPASSDEGMSVVRFLAN